MRSASAGLGFAALMLLSTPAFATTTYRILYGASDVTQSTPLRRDQSIPLSGDGTLTFTARGFASPGHIGLYDRIDQWAGPLGGGGRDCFLVAETNEFVISGPAGPPVSGSLHLRFRSTYGLDGGYPGNGAHGIGTEVQAMANNAWKTGDYWFGNAGTTTATGIFAGLSGNSVDVSFSISGTFPVGSPFTVRLQLFGRGGPYGNLAAVDPDYTEIVAGDPAGDPVAGGLRLEEVDGQIMALPAGYTVNCPSWGVVNNHFQSTVSVEDAAPGADLALSLHPNPAAGEVNMRLTLPREGPARVEVFDARGRRVRTLADGLWPAGTQWLRWDGRTESGESAPTGIYFVRAEVARQVLRRKVVRLE